ncbi:MAG TPA: PilZ domain-containing protein, partial [Pseudomonadota bacterium]|nr:PilZ domain-containing protein [Pseudomonadota bacterium]
MSAENSGVRLEPAQGGLAIRFQLQYGDVDAFIRGYAVNLSPAGMFIACREPPAVGTTLQFEVVLADGRPVVRGEGQVVWTTGAAAHGGAAAADAVPLCGFGLRFDRLTAASRAVVAQVLAHKAAHPEQFFAPLADPYAGSGSPAGLPPAWVPPVPPASASPALTSPAPASTAPASLLPAAVPAAPGDTPRAFPLPPSSPFAGSPADEEAALQALLRSAPRTPLPAP